MIEYSGYEYYCSSQETFDSIALMVYGDENCAADLMNANPEHAGTILFTGGERLLLPILEVPEDEDDEEEDELATANAPWKEYGEG